jgi:uncharacterized protein (DUF488 family)
MIFTVGHSNHRIEVLMDLLQQHGVTAIVDVRSKPVSNYTPHFSRDALAPELHRHQVAYVFLGDCLGGRSANPDCYQKGRLQYAKLALEPAFEVGIDRVKKGMLQFRIALLCSEKDPLGCHRALLVGRRLFQDGLDVQHILVDGSLESHDALETRMLELCKQPSGDMFRDRNDCIADAYTIQGGRVAHADETMLNESDRTV